MRLPPRSQGNRGSSSSSCPPAWVGRSFDALATFSETAGTVSHEFESGYSPLDCGGCDAALAGCDVECQGEPGTAKAPPLAAHSIADDTSAGVLLKN
jgi:hypothetical protein